MKKPAILKTEFHYVLYDEIWMNNLGACKININLLATEKLSIERKAGELI